MICYNLSNKIFLIYAGDKSLVCQHKDISKIENQLNEDFCSICDWLVDNKLSMHFSENKTKLILFASKFKRKNIKKLHIKYGDYKLNNILKSSTGDAYWMKQYANNARVLHVVNNSFASTETPTL